MRVILDTNVLLGALISPYGPPDIIYRAWRAAKFELVTSSTQLDELRRVSRYPQLKTILPAHRVGTMVNNMQRAIVLGTLPPPRMAWTSTIPMMFSYFPWHWPARQITW